MAEKRTPKVHELLAVADRLWSNANHVVNEAVATFGKDDRFSRTVTKVRYYNEEEAARLDETKTSDMTTTVGEKMKHVQTVFSEYLDMYAAKETACNGATENVYVDGEILIANAPVGLLLGLEEKIGILRKLLTAVPTLEPGIVWNPDPGYRVGAYKAENMPKRTRGKKALRWQEIAPPTKEHKAQVEKWTEDVPVADIIEDVWSGKITVAEKAEWLTRLSRMEVAVKQARQRIGKVDASPVKIGDKIFSYLMTGATEPTGA